MNKKNTLGPGLVIGIPTLGRPICLDWALAFKGMNPPMNFNVTFSIVKDQQVADARNLIAEQALSVGAKYLFFLGDDVICPAHTLRQLIFRMEQDESLGVVGGVYCCKAEPSAPLVFRGNGKGSYWDWKIGEYFSVTGLGMDCTLIRTEILNHISKPWFKTVDEDQFIDGINKAESWTEDLYFFNKMLTESMFGVFCDASVICGHHDPYSGITYNLPKDSLPLRELVVNQDKKCLMLGPPVDVPNDYGIITIGDDNVDYRSGVSAFTPFNEGMFDKVVVSIELDRPRDIISWVNEGLRVCKSQIHLRIHPSINAEILLENVAGNFTWKMDGPFLEITRAY